MVKRFNPDFSLSISHELAYMRETPEGGYVAYGDYATLFSELELVKADRDAQQKRADALAVENAEMRGAIDAAIVVAHQSSGIAGWHLNGDIAGWDEILPELNIETPATDAALAAIEALGVEKAIDLLLNEFSGTGHIGVPVMALESLAIKLREAK